MGSPYIYFSGKISCKELKYVLTSIGENLTEVEFAELIKEADIDGDGSISFEGTYMFIWRFLAFEQHIRGIIGLP